MLFRPQETTYVISLYSINQILYPLYLIATDQIKVQLQDFCQNLPSVSSAFTSASTSTSAFTPTAVSLEFFISSSKPLSNGKMVSQSSGSQ